MILLDVLDRNGVKQCEIVNPKKDLLMTAPHCNLYLAQIDWTEAKGTVKRPCFLRIATERAHNGAINAEAMLLNEMNDRARLIDLRGRSHGCEEAHFEMLIPQLYQTFLTDKKQGGRQANILLFSQQDASKLFPLAKLEKYCQIDCRTSVWMLGRCLKLQTFLDIQNSNLNISPSQFLVSPVNHRLIYLGLFEPKRYKWADERQKSRNPPGKQNLSKIFKFFRDWIEPNKLNEEPEYAQLLEDFIVGSFVKHNIEDREDIGAAVHEVFYNFIRSYWGIKYHPFTYFIRDTQQWKQNDSPFEEGE